MTISDSGLTVSHFHAAISSDREKITMKQKVMLVLGRSNDIFQRDVSFKSEKALLVNENSGLEKISSCLISADFHGGVKWIS